MTDGRFIFTTEKREPGFYQLAPAAHEPRQRRLPPALRPARQHRLPRGDQPGGAVEPRLRGAVPRPGHGARGRVDRGVQPLHRPRLRQHRSEGLPRRSDGHRPERAVVTGAGVLPPLALDARHRLVRCARRRRVRRVLFSGGPSPAPRCSSATARPAIRRSSTGTTTSTCSTRPWAPRPSCSAPPAPRRSRRSASTRARSAPSSPRRSTSPTASPSSTAARPRADVDVLSMPVLTSLVFQNTPTGRVLDPGLSSVDVYEELPPASGVVDYASGGTNVTTDSFGQVYVRRRSMGTTNVYSDGSAHFKIPGGVPIVLPPAGHGAVEAAEPAALAARGDAVLARRVRSPVVPAGVLQRPLRRLPRRDDRSADRLRGGAGPADAGVADALRVGPPRTISTWPRRNAVRFRGRRPVPDRSFRKL